MKQSTQPLRAALDVLSRRARSTGLTDAQWAARAGVRKETLSRLRSRSNCDFATLQALAEVVGATAAVIEGRAPGLSADGHFPAKVDRNHESQLLDLCASGNLDPERWRRLGPAFFMAGLAVMLASAAGSNRRGLCDLAEQLHPGSTRTDVFSLWLARSPVRPSRFLPLLAKRSQHAA